MRIQFQSFVVRWLLNSLWLWLAIKLFGTGYTDSPEGFFVFLFAGLIFSLVNAMLRPVIVILSLPMLLLTLGLFMLVINGILVYISLKLAPGISVTFVNAILTGVVISLLNYLVTHAVEIDRSTKKGEEVT